MLRVLPLADRVEEELLAEARAAGGTAFGTGSTTARELERALLAAAGLGPIDATAAELLAASVLPEEEAHLGAALLAVYDAWREGGGSVAELGRAARRVPGLAGRRAERLHRFARAYEQALAARGLTDGAGARARLPGALATARLPDEVARAGAVAVEDAVELTPARAALYAALGARVRVAVRLPRLGDRPPLAPSLDALERALADAAAVEIAHKEYGGGALAPLHDQLLTGAAASLPRARLDLVEADDPPAEVRAIVAAVRRLLDGGAAADDVCVAVRGLAAWRARLGAALDEAAIPWRDRRGADALSAPPCALALAVIDLALRGLPRPELSRLLTSRYIEGGVPAAGGEPFIPARRVAEYLRAAGSRDDAGEGHAARVAALAARFTVDERPREARAATRVAAHLSTLLPELRLPARATLAGHLAALGAALARLGVDKKARAREEREGGELPAIDRAAADALARDQAGLRALAAVDGALAAAARRVGLARDELPLARFRDLFAVALARATLPPRGARGGAVLLLDAGDLAGRRFAHLVLGGLTDGRFPLRRPPEPLLDDDDRAAVNRAAGRAVFQSRAAAEPLRFALACMAARESLTATRARVDDEGRETVPSPYFDELVRFAEAPRRAAAAVLAPAPECTSATQLLARAAALARGVAPAADEDAPALLAALRDDARLGPRLATAERRARADGSGGFGGRITDGDALAALAARLAADAAPVGDGVAWLTSASQLEAYAACPFKFFAGTLLGLREPDPVEDDLDLREGGTLLHAVARSAFAALAEAGLLPLAGGARAAAEAEAAMRAVEEALDRWEAARRTGPAALWALRRQQARVALGRVLEAERREGAAATVLALEAPFGDRDSPPLYLPAPDGARRIAVRGRVDRVDRDGDAVVVIDYKSGRVDDRLHADEVARTQFQLPLYAAWARGRFGAAAVDAYYRSLRDGGRSRLLSAACDPARLDPAPRGAAVAPAAGALDLPDGGASLAEAAWALHGALAAGRFDVRPHDPDAACAACSFATVCRVDRNVEDAE